MFLLYNKFIIIAINAVISQMVTFWIKWRSVLKSSYLKKIFFFSSPTGVESISDLPEYRFGSCMGSAPVGQLRKFSFWVIRLVNSHKLTFGFCCAWYVLWKLGRRLNTPIVPNPRFNPYKRRIQNMDPIHGPPLIFKRKSPLLIWKFTAGQGRKNTDS